MEEALVLVDNEGRENNKLFDKEFIEFMEFLEDNLF